MTSTITKANKSDKKEILRFYKQQHYSARFLGFDQAYYIKKNEAIIACVITSKITEYNHQTFLHALVIDKDYFHQKLASRLLKYCVRQHPTLICFADISLAPLYLQNGFVPTSTKNLSEILQQRFNSYSFKNKQLQAFIFQ